MSQLCQTLQSAQFSCSEHVIKIKVCHSLSHPPTHPHSYPLMHPPTHAPNHSPTHPLTHSLTHSPTHSLTHSLMLSPPGVGKTPVHPGAGHCIGEDHEVRGRQVSRPGQGGVPPPGGQRLPQVNRPACQCYEGEVQVQKSSLQPKHAWWPYFIPHECLGSCVLGVGEEIDTAIVS